MQTRVSNCTVVAAPATQARHGPRCFSYVHQARLREVLETQVRGTQYKAGPGHCLRARWAGTGARKIPSAIRTTRSSLSRRQVAPRRGSERRRGQASCQSASPPANLHAFGVGSACARSTRKYRRATKPRANERATNRKTMVANCSFAAWMIAASSSASGARQRR